MVLIFGKQPAILPRLLLAGLLILLAAVPAWALLEAGPGMRFESQQVYVRDAQGLYFQTDLQELLGSLSVHYTEGPWQARLTGAWADWNPGGDWQGSNLEQTSLNPFFWEWQEDLAATVSYEVWRGLSLGAGYADTSVRHYRGNDQFTYLQYRTRAFEVLANYMIFQGLGLAFSAEAAYAPYSVFEAYLNSNLPDIYPTVHRLDMAGTGTRWRGALQGSYHFPRGLSVNLIYDQGFARFPAPAQAEEFSLGWGRLSGYLEVAF
jgi:hypothetical protein